MSDILSLQSILIIFSVPIFFVILFRRLYLSSVLAYLVSGALIGENGFGFTSHQQTGFIAEFGVVFLLFSIGLELSFERLKAMRKYVFGIGSLQIILTGITFWVIAQYFMEYRVAMIVAGGLALSSTAVVLKIINDKKLQSTQLGRIALGILLQQDFAVVPLLVILPLLDSSNPNPDLGYALLVAMVKAIIAMSLIFIAGRTILRPLFKLISSESDQNNNEIFIAATILIALSSAYITEYMGLSMALGAFLSGILVSETEFRTAAEDSIFPFKDLLLGLFFMHVGMTINIFDIVQDAKLIVLGSLLLILSKTIIIAFICKMLKFSNGVSLNVGFLLSQGGEFGFVLFKLCDEYHLLDAKITKFLLILVTLSMALTPLMNAIGEKLGLLLDKKKRVDEGGPAIDFGSRDLNKHVIICGFGDIGKLIGKILASEGIGYIALDLDRTLVKNNYHQYPVFRADITHLEILKAAGIERCELVILAINNLAASRKTIKMINDHYPKLEIISRASNLSEISDQDSAIMVPSDCETALQISSVTLRNYGVNEFRISAIKDLIRKKRYNISKDILKEKVNSLILDE